MRRITIALLESTAEDEARKLLKRGGRCNSYEVLEALFRIGPKKDSKRIVFTRLDIRDGKGQLRELDYGSVRCCIEQNFEVRPRAEAQRQGGERE